MLLPSLFVTCFCLVTVHGRFYLYDSTKKIPTSCNSSNSFSDRKLTPQFIAKYKLWPNIITDYGYKSGETVAGFVDGLEAAYMNQHPADCKNSKFLISNRWDQGFGSELHILGSGLAVAMNMGRVFIWNDEQLKSANSAYSYITKNKFCRDEQHKDNLDCYFEPWTNCTWDDVMHGKPVASLNQSQHVVIGKLVRYGTEDSSTPEHERWNREERVLVAEDMVSGRDHMPYKFRPQLECSPYYSGRTFWWKSVAAAFMIRPNAAVLKLIEQHRQDETIRFNAETEQCVSVHVRHGDKHVEMQIMPVQGFFNVSEILWSNLQNQSSTNTVAHTSSSHQHHVNVTHNKHNGISSKQQQPIMFIGTEDTEALVQAKNWTADNHWKLLYTNVFDRNTVSTGLNYTMQQQMIKTNTQLHHEWEYFSMILNIDSHLRCSAFVCTLASNFCRVIDELRATVANKANAQFAEMQFPFQCIDCVQMKMFW